jgi:hypothetical protein
MTPESRALRARIAAHMAHAKHGSRKMTENARKVNPSSDAYWYAKTDPSLSDEERHARARHLKKAHFSQLALKSARARKQVL